MANRSLRGMGLGNQSLETEDGVVLAKRYDCDYLCINGHEFSITFALDVQPPKTWECHCSAKAYLKGGEDFEADLKVMHAQRTHWDMLIERRSEEELEELLEQQLQALRNGDLRRRSFTM
ncbi:RNA polymerase-binding protein RbpA [Actinomyces sp. zg-332]|uniref:RNA polymerase-binding protein RbpA n=1 Tax=Actinomyces sp. zg-332 TaxID=2708340 RepID=UPI001423581A|nr:RNA polymerase-binding protein RbpA [Actinomyces sp. zg-332]QPK94693.1 RNA polymerase-binding protein RbpA [Actinomyces sp. zg-332]